jgi:predicted nucleic acid-binding protein
LQLKATIDSSVIIALGKLGYLKLVCRLFDKLIISESVLEEIRKDPVYREISELTKGELVEVAKCSKQELLNVLSSSLGKGETETIVLAIELEADFALLDDLKARKTGRRLKVKVMGTLALLRVLLDLRLVNEKPEDLCGKLIAQGFWVDAETCLKVLKE